MLHFRQRGILCIKIPGIVRGNRETSDLSRDKPNHVWNAVFLAGRWNLVDCTWGAGYVREQTGCFHQEMRLHYLFTDPRDFIRDHFPLRSEWQLLQIPVDWNMFTSCALVKYGYFIYRPIIPEYYNKHTLLCGGDINIRLGLTTPLSTSYDLFMVRNNETLMNKSSHVSLRTYKNAVIISCNFLSNGSYLLNLYGKPKYSSDMPKPIVCYCIEVTEGNLAATLSPFSKCDIVWGTRYYFERAGLHQPGIFTTHHITNQPCWTTTLRYMDNSVRFKVSLHYLNNNNTCRHGGKCQVVRNSGIITLSASHLIPGYYAVTLLARTEGTKEYVTTMVLLLQYIMDIDRLVKRGERAKKNICDV